MYCRHLRFLNGFLFLFFFLAGHCIGAEKVGVEERGRTL